MSLLDIRDRLDRACHAVDLIDIAASDITEKRQRNALHIATETLAGMLESIEADLAAISEAEKRSDP